jgi:hypothetical protein
MLLERLTAAYRLGRSSCYQPQTDSSNDPYWNLVDAVGDNHVPLSERMIFRRCRLGVSEGLRHARRGQFASARQRFVEVRWITEQEGRSDEVRCLGQTVLAAAEAYLSYHQGKYDLARRKLHEAMAIDLQLEAERGYGILHLHRVNLVYNLVQVDGREWGREHMVVPLVNLILYLEGACSEPAGLVPTTTGLNPVPPPLVSSLLEVYAADLAVIWTSFDPEQVAALVPLLEPLTMERATPRFRNHLIPAFRLKQVLPGEPCANRLIEVSPLLAGGRGTSPGLWYSLIIDVARCLAGFPSLSAPRLREEILCDAVDWLDFPAALRPRLRDLVGGEHV